jgi:hypothetical protein
MICPYCKKDNPFVSYACRDNDHIFSYNGPHFFLSEDPIERSFMIGMSLSGHFISLYDEKYIRIIPFPMEDSLLYLRKYKKLLSFI